ncbi:ThiF family adenylyltransferase [bacterium]|nr:ThiF family adenylyltransferase [bacterium]
MEIANRFRSEGRLKSLPAIDRYSRQERFALIGKEGQEKLRASRVAVCGVGALGTVIAGTLARAGVGYLRLIDRDIVEWSNLQRQILFDEEDARTGRPKAEAAAKHLSLINKDVTVEPIATELNARSAQDLLSNVDLIVDGCDNFDTRFLINDFSLRHRVPWIYGGAIGASGQSMTILPGRTPCLRCLIETPPPPGSLPTCETAGIIAPASMIIASIESAEAIKILAGQSIAVTPGLFVLDLWNGTSKRINLDSLKDNPHCPACGRGEYPWLEGTLGSSTTSLCGRDAVQVIPSRAEGVDWERLKRDLSIKPGVQLTPFLVRFEAEGFEFSVFRDGRAIIRGTDDVVLARSLYARHIGC